ncbi:hypothetical protein [Vulgatibacter incomptus]|uniref:hypothetical protein n=1 Tax=Vulgatibacter incomptus TaxID=1391653 RepID=UPI0006807C49|nr:hypothetical protein [Vulgatibacter incomptus]
MVKLERAGTAVPQGREATEVTRGTAAAGREAPAGTAVAMPAPVDTAAMRATAGREERQAKAALAVKVALPGTGARARPAPAGALVTTVTLAWSSGLR